MPGVGWDALAQLSAPDTPSVDGAALEAEVGAPTGAGPAADAAARLEAALAAECAHVATWISVRYPELPDRAAGDAPTAVSAAVVSLALARLLRGEEWGEEARRATAWLRAVSRGEALLDADSDGEPDDSARIGIDARTPVFTRDSLGGFGGLK